MVRFETKREGNKERQSLDIVPSKGSKSFNTFDRSHHYPWLDGRRMPCSATDEEAKPAYALMNESCIITSF